MPSCIVPKLTKPILTVLALSEWRVFRILQFPSIPDEVDAVDVVEGLGVAGDGCIEYVGYYSHFLRLASVSDN